MINYTFIKQGFIDPKKVILNAVYQRDEEAHRRKQIEISMRTRGGYDLAYPIVVNQNFTVVEGGHRTRLSIELGIEKIPYVQYYFQTSQDEITYYNEVQKSNRGMTARDQLWSHFTGNKSYAKFIYEICEHRSSKIKGLHDLKTSSGMRSSTNLIKVENICYMINAIVLGKKTGWAATSAHILNSHADAYIQNHNIYAAVIKINNFLDFFFAIYGQVTEKKSLIYREAFFNGFLTMYTDKLMSEERFRSNDKERERVIKKLKRFPIDLSVTKNSRAYIVNLLLSVINNKCKEKNFYMP